jgi:endonuclease-3
MLEKRSVKEIFERLAAAIPQPGSELIAHNDYTFAVAVILSAQTTDKSVNKATFELFKIADTPEKMVSLGLEDLKSHIKTLGLYNSKAQNIISMSHLLIDSYNSNIPNDRDELEKLPGIGRKSANVIANQLFKKGYIAVDTHVLRLSHRLDLSDSKNPKIVERDLMLAIPKRFHIFASDLLVLHGRYTCIARNPKCGACVIRDLCKFHNTGAHATSGP